VFVQDTFLQNPQYRFDILDDTKRTVLIQLQQKEKRIHAKSSQRVVRTIGFHVVKVGNCSMRKHKNASIDSSARLAYAE